MSRISLLVELEQMKGVLLIKPSLTLFQFLQIPLAKEQVLRPTSSLERA